MPPVDHVSTPDAPEGPEGRGLDGRAPAARRAAGLDGSGQQDSATARPARRRPRRVVRPGTEQAGVAGLGSDDDAAAWGDARPGAANDRRDAELLRDVPPHWS